MVLDVLASLGHLRRTTSPLLHRVNKIHSLLASIDHVELGFLHFKSMLLLSQILNLHHIELVFTHAFQIKFKFLVLIHHLFFFIGQFFTLLYVLLIALTKLVFPRVDQVTFSGRCCHGSLGLS